MAPEPRRHRFALPARVPARSARVTAVLVLGAGIAAPAVAHAAQPARPAVRPALAAAPKPSESELRKQLDALNTEAEKLTEAYNKTRVELGKARAAEKQAGKVAADLERQAAPAREQIGRLAAANYMNGGPDSLFFANGSADGLSDSAYLAQKQSAVVTRLQGQIDQANKAEQEAQRRAAQVQQATDQALKARSAAKAKVDEVVKQLDKLTTTNVKDPKTGLKATVKGSDLPAKMARKALTKIGSPYVWAAAGPSTFDCSGLVVWAYAQLGKKGLPHYTGDLYELGSKVDKGDLRSGDLVYFGSNLHHMGIYLSDGKYLHAPQTGDVVKISKLSDRSDYAGANRIS
ncbi:NlpC/P60 family protein [Spirillospora sp. CA-253888]